MLHKPDQCGSGGLGVGMGACAVAVARQDMPEQFHIAAWAELENCPMHVPGECFLPECSKNFNPVRADHKFCSAVCERAQRNEERTWGHKSAKAILAWGMVRHPKKNSPEADRTRIAMKHIAQVQSAWVKCRNGRRKAALKGRGGL